MHPLLLLHFSLLFDLGQRAIVRSRAVPSDLLNYLVLRRAVVLYEAGLLLLLWRLDGFETLISLVDLLPLGWLVLDFNSVHWVVHICIKGEFLEILRICSQRVPVAWLAYVRGFAVVEHQEILANRDYLLRSQKLVR